MNVNDSEKTLGEKSQERVVELRKIMGNLPEVFGLVWRADKGSTLRIGVFTAIGALLPLAQAYTGKLIIDGVVASINSGETVAIALQGISPYLILEFVLFATSSLISHSRRLIEQILEHKAGHAITEQIIRKALTLELKYFEDSHFYDKMQNARRESEYRALAVINGSFNLVQNFITLISFLFVLLAMTPAVALILFLATIPSFAVQTRYSNLKFRLQSWRAPETRKMIYLEQVLTMDSTVKEVKLFKLGDLLLDRYKKTFQSIFEEDLTLARKRMKWAYFWGLLSTISFYLCYAWIIYLTVQQKITLGDMTLYLGAVKLSQGSFQGILDNISKLYENGLFMENLFSFLSIQSSKNHESNTTNKKDGHAQTPNVTLSEEGGDKVAISQRHSSNGRALHPPTIRFENVSYQYPNSENWAIRDLQLEIRPGEKFALVGENGSGKTTLIKLLSGLYQPTSGRILINDKDLSEIESAEIHSKIGVIFQDYVRYQLTLRENIGFGLADELENTSKIESAIESSGSQNLLTELPEGLATMLGHQFRKGRELSVGQWQKVALGRAFMRDAEILILDEPTSSLDANREFEIFERMQKLTSGKTVLLISHRFSTVRMADRIAVLDQGQLKEIGSHEELLSLNGIYAKMFEIQAIGYR